MPEERLLVIIIGIPFFLLFVFIGYEFPKARKKEVALDDHENEISKL